MIEDKKSTLMLNHGFERFQQEIIKLEANLRWYALFRF